MALGLEIVVEREGRRRAYRSPTGMVAVDGLSVAGDEVRVEGIDERGRRVFRPAEANADPEVSVPAREPAPRSLAIVTEPFQDIRVRIDGGDWRWMRSDERGAATLEWEGAEIEVRCATADGVMRRAMLRW